MINREVFPTSTCGGDIFHWPVVAVVVVVVLVVVVVVAVAFLFGVVLFPVMSVKEPSSFYELRAVISLVDYLMDYLMDSDLLSVSAVPWRASF